MISSSWFLFHEEIVKIKHYLGRKLIPCVLLISKLSSFLRTKKKKNEKREKRVTIDATKNAVRYYKLLYIGHISTNVKRKINRFCKFYC